MDGAHAAAFFNAQQREIGEIYLNTQREVYENSDDRKGLDLYPCSITSNNVCRL